VPFFFISEIVDPDALGGYEGTYFDFVLVGLLLGALATVGLGSLTEAIRGEQSSGTLEVILATPAALPTILLGSMVVPIGFVALEVAVVLLVAVVFLGAELDAAGIPIAVLAVVPTLAVFASLGACSAAFLVLSKRGDPVTPLFSRLATFLSGSLFPVAVLPAGLAFVAKLLPPYYALLVFRGALLNGEGLAELWQELLVLFGFAAVMLPLALLCFRSALRTARRTGTLGSY
jgi:ABC-2 type transport system permease protein